jgi:hypothetical protein
MRRKVKKGSGRWSKRIDVIQIPSNISSPSVYWAGRHRKTINHVVRVLITQESNGSPSPRLHADVSANFQENQPHARSIILETSAVLHSHKSIRKQRLCDAQSVILRLRCGTTTIYMQHIIVIVIQ